MPNEREINGVGEKTTQVAFITYTTQIELCFKVCFLITQDAFTPSYDKKE